MAERIEQRNENRATCVEYFKAVEELEALTARVDMLKQRVMAIIAEGGHDVDGTASGKTDRMETTIQYRGEPTHLRLSVTTSIGRVNNTKVIAEANRRIRALGGEEVNPEDFRGNLTFSTRLEWVEKEDEKKATKKATKKAANKQ